MKKAYFILLLFIFVACNKETEIFKSDKFSVSNTFVDTNVLKAYYPILANDNIYFASKDMHTMMTYNIKHQKTDTLLVSPSKIVRVSPLNDTNIFFYIATQNGEMLKNTLTSDYNFLKNVKNTVTHPYWGKNFIIHAGANQMTRMGTNRWIAECHYWYCYAEGYSLMLKNKIPVFIIFDLDKDTNIIPVSFFGWYPQSYPDDNYFDGGFLYYCYNKNRNEIICYTKLHDSIVLCDSLGRRIRDCYYGSKFHNRVPFQKKEDKTAIAVKIHLLSTCTYYGPLIYDSYRNVYLRVLCLPRPQDKNEIFKTENVEDYLIIVADENINIKYEVFFDGDEYALPIGNLLINEQGVLIFKQNKENEKDNKKNEENATWFIFD